MEYKQIQPPDCLKRYVRYFWLWESKAADNRTTTFRPISDGCPGVIFQGSEKELFYDQDNKQLPALFLYGQTIKHREIRMSGSFDILGICFYPYALKLIFNLAADELTDTCANLDLLSEKQNFFLLEQLVNTPATITQIELLATYLSAQIRKNNNPPDRITEYALTQIIKAKGSISLKELQKDLQVSERNLERRFRQYVGISAKLFSRISRFQTALNQLKNNNFGKLSDVAFENGYADQSHFIRAFKEFAGYSPYQYQKQASGTGENLAEWIS